ncbi:MAG TPA: ribose-5-phosphate isomerase RpiA [Geminicoccaceae bacterium]|nr:ribose-5-phosphate isomerase RpiA [Geminicoccaceae bacterium]
MSDENLKRQAAQAALELLPERGVLGLGTGTTTRWFIEAVGDLVRGGRQLVAVPTSRASRELAARLGIPLLDDAGPWEIELCVDGADEVSATLDLIKGGGGAHTREKIVNFAARRNVIIVDDSKLSSRLGEKRKVPVEVLPFGAKTTEAALGKLGTPQLRQQDGAPYRTDSGNLIYDLGVGPIDDPQALDARLHTLPGVVETGLFLGRVDVVVVASAGGIRRLTR